MSRFVHTWHIPGIRCEHMSDVVRICQNQLAKIENAKHGNFYACLWHLLTVMCIHACIHAIVRTSFFGWDSSMTLRLCKAVRVVSCVRLKSQGPKHQKSSTLFPPQITQFSWVTNDWRCTEHEFWWPHHVISSNHLHLLLGHPTPLSVVYFSPALVRVQFPPPGQLLHNKTTTLNRQKNLQITSQDMSFNTFWNDFTQKYWLIQSNWSQKHHLSMSLYIHIHTVIYFCLLHSTPLYFYSITRTCGCEIHDDTSRFHVFDLKGHPYGI